MLASRGIPHDDREAANIGADFAPHLFSNPGRDARIAYIVARGIEFKVCIAKIELLPG